MQAGDLKTKNHLFTHKDDYLNLSEVVRDFPLVNEVAINSNDHYKSLLKEINDEPHAIPMFIKDNNDEIHIISSLPKDFLIEKGTTLMYLGKTII